MKIKYYKNFFKRIFDFAASLFGLIITLPVFIILIPIVCISNRGPIFFTQLRPGRNERLFHLIKFKTMNDKRGNSGKLLPDKDRITAIGRFLRSFSLDELPQLINVLKGDMSLVGPRPLLPEYLALYNSQQARRHEVQPGITGWAQVNGRNTLSWESKFELDVWYVEHISFVLDMKILCLTFKKTLKQEGISSRTTITMEKFTGS